MSVGLPLAICVHRRAGVLNEIAPLFQRTICSDWKHANTSSVIVSGNDVGIGAVNSQVTRPWASCGSSVQWIQRSVLVDRVRGNAAFAIIVGDLTNRVQMVRGRID